MRLLRNIPPKADAAPNALVELAVPAVPVVAGPAAPGPLLLCPPPNRLGVPPLPKMLLPDGADAPPALLEFWEVLGKLKLIVVPRKGRAPPQRVNGQDGRS